MDQAIYLDNAASTRVAEEVIARMAEVMRGAWGNPSAAHPQGAAARAHLALARRQVLAGLGDPDGRAGDLVWTSGCTEADALAVLGVARRRPGPIVISAVEHPAVAATADLAGPDAPVRRVAPDRTGRLAPDAVAAAARAASVVAVIMVQNEVGAVQPVAEIAAAVRAVAPGCHLHVDAAQALGKVPLDVAALGADSVAIAGHKLHGPKGVGALWVRHGVELAPLWGGGGQQDGRRPGSEDTPAIAGLGLAVERAVAALPFAAPRWRALADAVTGHLDRAGRRYRRLIDEAHRAPHILALGLPGAPADALRAVLTSRGVLVSTGSACAARSRRPSPALEALGLSPDVGVVRLSFALDTREAEADAAGAALAEVVGELAVSSRTPS